MLKIQNNIAAEPNTDYKQTSGKRSKIHRIPNDIFSLIADHLSDFDLVIFVKLSSVHELGSCTFKSAQIFFTRLCGKENCSRLFGSY